MIRAPLRSVLALLVLATSAACSSDDDMTAPSGPDGAVSDTGSPGAGLPGPGAGGQGGTPTPDPGVFDGGAPAVQNPPPAAPDGAGPPQDAPPPPNPTPGADAGPVMDVASGGPPDAACTPGAPGCAPASACAVANGGCGPAATWRCVDKAPAAPLCLPLSAVVINDKTVIGRVAGLAPGATATVTLGNDGYLASQVVGPDQSYRFLDLPNGKYFLKIEVAGHKAAPAREIVVESLAKFGALADEPRGADPRPTAIDFEVEPLPKDAFRYHWEEDGSRSGWQQSAYINKPPVIEFLAEPVKSPDLAAASNLRAQFAVVLSDEEEPWTEEYAYRLLETLKTIPQASRAHLGEKELTPSKWVLTKKRLDKDVELVFGQDGHRVTISAEAFVYATPRLALLDGQRGRFFSKRLHHALTRYVTRNGTDEQAVEKILNDRFGCTTQVPDFAALTAPTTKEDAHSFQSFHSAERLAILNMFEEMPDGYHKVAGLRYLVRRKDGVPHPLYDAPAVAWAWPEHFPQGSYIEFMESAFNVNPDHMHRLILHEKAHFLWAYTFSKGLKDDWIKLGGWYPNPGDPDGWSTTNTTEFVSAYAHKKNPDEDMAESLSVFVLNPDLLRSRSLRKFEFIRDRIMQGSRYLARIPTDLTFEVLNLYPDYEYPGKIKRVDIVATGAPDQDKQVKVEIALHTADRVFAGASKAYFRVFSEIGTFHDVYLDPVDAKGAVLRGQFTISKYAKAGHWRPDQIVVTDAVGNQRLEGVNDYGWKLYIDNPLEDLVAPSFVPGTLTVQRFDDTVTENGSSFPVHRVEVKWQVIENRQMRSESPVYARLVNPTVDNTYPFEAWGTFDAATSTAKVVFHVTQFAAPGEYNVPYVMMLDQANNKGDQTFSPSPRHQPLVSVQVPTTNYDTTAPEVALNDDPAAGVHRIRISAKPTNPTAPNGETLVNIRYHARDDKSGLGVVSYRLLDPQGISHHQFHYHKHFYTQFFQGEPTAWAEYEINVVLPVGSPPGTWGLQELVVRDKAGNQRSYSFVETVRFDVER
jgi:hypothetical protein